MPSATTAVRPTETRGALYFAVDAVNLALEALVYVLSLAPSLALVQAGFAHGPWTGLFALVAGWYLTALVFVLVVLALARGLLGRIRPGRYLLTSPRALPWIGVDRLVKLVHRSPFRGLIFDNAFYRALYLRGMGADVTTTLLLGQRVVIPEPYLLKAGHQVLIGDEAVITGHKVEHNVVTLERVELGNNVLVGARAVLLPGVKVGDNATIGAGAVVGRGTVIPAGETWAGVPATKVELFPRTAKKPAA